MASVCLVCDARVPDSKDPYLFTWKGKRACHTCGTNLIPGREDDFVTVRIRWQELRLLFTLAQIATEEGLDDEHVSVVLRRLITRFSPNRPTGLPPLTPRQLDEEMRLQGIDFGVIDTRGRPWPALGASSEPTTEQGI